MMKPLHGQTIEFSPDAQRAVRPALLGWDCLRVYADEPNGSTLVLKLVSVGLVFSEEARAVWLDSGLVELYL